MNKILLRKFIKHAKAHPKHIDMESFTSSVEINEENVCGTTMCIAGFGVIENRNKLPIADQVLLAKELRSAPYELVEKEFDFSKYGRKFYGLTEKQADKLFYFENWPEPFKTQYDEFNWYVDDINKRTKVVVQRVEYFIKTGK